MQRRRRSTSGISIHALREEGDRFVTSQLCILPISIHALREEGDANDQPNNFCSVRFLSTPSARRATRWNGARNRRRL